MSLWSSLVGKRIFVRLPKRVYEGEVLEVDVSSSPHIFITMRERHGEIVTFKHTEIQELKEEGNE